MVMKRSREDQALGSQPPQAPPPTEAQNRAADLQSQDPNSPPDADEAQKSMAREEQIRQAAYEAYLRRAGAAGGELEDWLEAERSIGQASAPPAPDGNPD